MFFSFTHLCKGMIAYSIFFGLVSQKNNISAGEQSGISGLEVVSLSVLDSIGFHFVRQSNREFCEYWLICLPDCKFESEIEMGFFAG